MIPGDILSACPHRQFHTLPGLLDSRAALPNSYPNACVPMQRGSLYHFNDGLWYDPAGTRSHNLPCERRTCLPLSQPDTVINLHEAHGVGFIQIVAVGCRRGARFSQPDRDVAFTDCTPSYRLCDVRDLSVQVVHDLWVRRIFKVLNAVSTSTIIPRINKIYPNDRHSQQDLS